METYAFVTIEQHARIFQKTGGVVCSACIEDIYEKFGYKKSMHTTEPEGVSIVGCFKVVQVKWGWPGLARVAQVQPAGPYGSNGTMSRVTTDQLISRGGQEFCEPEVKCAGLYNQSYETRSPPYFSSTFHYHV